jgi:hypothetical protein
MYSVIVCDTVRFGREMLTFRRDFFYPEEEGRSFSETLVRICPITQRHIPQNSNIHSHRRQNLKSLKQIFVLVVKCTLGQP